MAPAPPIPVGLDATIVLLRHGESTAIVEGRFQGRLDVPLSPLGSRQAALAAERLAQPHRAPALPVPIGPPSEIVHSPLARAAQTAAAAGDAIGRSFRRAVPLRPDDGFIELAQGEWEGMLAADIEARWADLLGAWRRTPLEAWAPGGESVLQAGARVRPALARLLGGLAAGRAAGSLDRSQTLMSADRPADHPWAILVGHDGVFKVILLTLLDLPLERFWAFPFALCGISVVEITAGRGRLRSHNLIDHLASLAGADAEERVDAREETGAL